MLRRGGWTIFTIAGGSATPIANFFAGDKQADLVVGTGGQVSRVRVYPGKNVAGASGEPAGFTDLDPYNGAVLADGVFVG